MKAKLLCISAILCSLGSGALTAAEVNLGSPTSRTPYDAYLAPMWSVMRNLRGGQPDPGTVDQLVRQGNSFRYVFKKEQPYEPQPPDVTESSKCGDCKAKSLWLAWKMGTPKVRYVIGKARKVSNMSHAWLIWDGPEGWIILDATNFNRPLAPQRVSPTEFIPTYSYAPSGRYTHTVSAAARGAKDGDH